MTHAPHGFTGELPEATHYDSRRSIGAIPLSGEPPLVTAVDQVWATDITYIPLQKAFLYLVPIGDLFSRKVLSWKLSNSLDIEPCPQALEIALGA